MAKLLHEEDLIFNKPSLKELIRLIKNGSIYAIWPSTEEEFKEWNNTGYLKYAPRGEKLKSQKTAMTVYYGDHQDASNTGTINQEDTIKKYNALVDKIDGYKNDIVNLEFYENINEIYPNDLTLQKLDNVLEPYLDQNGYIKNQEEIINYGEDILINYDKIVKILENFKERVNNFTPKIIDSFYVHEDSNVFTTYKNFFTTTTTELNNNFSNLIGNTPSINS